ncbi:hypothetical protein ABW636_09730 [Aquimarina sp. 2201CG1-2-11]|uniref:hypothetical protein n=1 Tax=Aquimarina discodermiae TaxID=3231043 RepID=UPI0034627695
MAKLVDALDLGSSETGTENASFTKLGYLLKLAMVGHAIKYDKNCDGRSVVMAYLLYRQSRMYLEIWVAL